MTLLRAKSAPFTLSFFYKVFKDSHVTTISNSELRSRLEGYMEDLEYEERDEELEANTLFDDISVKATQYIEKWSNAGFLRKYPGDDGEDLHELTSDTQKVLKWIDDLQTREFVGTNSRFRDIFFKLQEMIELSNENAEVRIQELEKKKWEIENEINLLKTGKTPIVYDDTELKERFYDLNKIARELLSDFTEVEQNFEQIRKDIQRKYAEKDMVKGSLLVFALDALDEIETKDQGKSFKAFWEFLMDERRQQNFSQLTDQLYKLLQERDIDYNNDRFLKNLKRYLHVSGRKVIDANKKLSEKISRVLAEKNLLERRRAMELIGDIRQLAYSLTESKFRDEQFLAIEDAPLLNLFDRWELSSEKDEMGAVTFPDGAGGELSEGVDLGSLFDQFAIDKKKLAGRIDAMLEGKTQVSLKEIIDQYGLENGLSEVIGYFSIATASSSHIILEETIDPIWVNGRKFNIPMVLYVKTQS
ncbi:DUF3375 domain-containing protein [Chitinophaga horti]|uniref:DUF3375 domain-containing protein n=1 Tax=Chitinophaga horti TaxID=2920382 RepID=A0ABY6IZK5_9BACT|nr:DUF3375 domain-containing protein [Chitinophaga horti]UYQ92843.1 DUF3375 domain-containing protein [Chitinophaga horti]